MTLRVPDVIRRRWVVRVLRPNPLVRTSDRLEALAVVAVFVIALIAVPVVVAVGQAVQSSRMSVIAEQQHTRREHQAVAVADSVSTPTGRGTTPRIRVTAQWPEGTYTRTQTVAYPRAVKAGTQLTIWLDRDGRVVDAPQSPSAAYQDARCRAGLLWLGIVSSATMGAVGFRYLLDRRRAVGWERELRLLAHNDDGWANRHI
jgi:hypothetical protein